MITSFVLELHRNVKPLFEGQVFKSIIHFRLKFFITAQSLRLFFVSVSGLNPLYKVFIMAFSSTILITGVECCNLGLFRIKTTRTFIKDN